VTPVRVRLVALDPPPVRPLVTAGRPAWPISSSRQEHLSDCPLALLLFEAHRGMEDAFAELHQRTRARLYATVLRVVRSPELAGEVTQEAYLEIWQQSGRYQEDKGSALGWMMMIARRRAVDRVRSVTRALALERRYIERNAVLSRVDSWDDVCARLEAEEVRGLLTALTPVQRQALTVTYLQQRPAAEAAKLLQVPVSTLKSRMRDGLFRLRAMHRPREDGVPADAERSPSRPL
jgi:RNA polymerase sigma-70 factor (ECF subfamily)